MPTRRELIGKLQEKRGGRLCVTYVTSTRTNYEVQMADDVLRWLYEHLQADRSAAEKGVDLFILSNGGQGTVPWRIVNLIREYTKHFALLVPNRAFSAATLVALGADEILMHRMGCLGPIDPSVANQFNPPGPNGQPVPISVEDVSAYLKLVEDSGIGHEDELIQAFLALAEKIHPLALGNVHRSHNQARMMAKKLLRKHMSATDEHEVARIIEDLKSNLFFHGHPINRSEAREDLKLKIVDPAPELEALMWDLFVEYERELKLNEPFSPLYEIEQALQRQAAAAPRPAAAPPTPPAPPGMPPGMPFNPFQPQQMQHPAKVRLASVPGAYVESAVRTDAFLSDLTIERIVINSPLGPQEGVKTEVIRQRWEQVP